MNVENCASSGYIRAIENDLTVETSRSQQRRIEHVRPVRRRDDDDVRTTVESVHLNEDLVQRLLAFIVASTQTCSTLATDSVNLIDKNDTGRALLGLLRS